MNICVFCQDYFGGIRSVSLTLADAWQRKGNCVHFMSLNAESNNYSNGSECIRQYFLPKFDKIYSDENI